MLQKIPLLAGFIQAKENQKVILYCCQLLLSYYFNLYLVFNLKFQSCLELYFPVSETTIFCNNKNTGMYYLFGIKQSHQSSVRHLIWIFYLFLLFLEAHVNLVLHVWKSVLLHDHFIANQAYFKCRWFTELGHAKFKQKNFMNLKMSKAF